MYFVLISLTLIGFSREYEIGFDGADGYKFVLGIYISKISIQILNEKVLYDSDKLNHLEL